MASVKDFFKNHYVGLTAGVIACIALGCSVKGCSRIDNLTDKVDSVSEVQKEIIDVVNTHEDRIADNRRDIDALKLRMTAAEDSIASHRAAIDSLAARQAECPCVKKSKKSSGKQNSTVVHVAANVPAQSANGCGNDQNASVVINGNNNVVTVSNNGGAADTVEKSDTTRNVSAVCVVTCGVDPVALRNARCR